MGALKTAGPMLARFVLCLALIACLWVVSISYRVGSFDFRDGWALFPPASRFPDSDGLLLAVSLALLVGLLGLYRSGRISTVLMVLACLLIITALDHAWTVYRAFDEYKTVPGYVLKPAIAAVLICPLTFLFPRRTDANPGMLVVCWAILAVTIVLTGSNSIGTHILHLEGMIGPTYMQDVFYCLLACELLRQARRWWLANRADLLLYP